jgi:cytochrome c
LGALPIHSIERDSAKEADMRNFSNLDSVLGVFVLLGGLSVAGIPAAYAQAANPCATKAANPCAMKPEVDPKLVTRPAGTALMKGDRAQLVREGEKLFKDTKLSTNGMACNTCHEANASFMPTFANPYPHMVAMAHEKGGVKQVHLDEMIQFCMVVPMEAKPLPWDSRELAALVAYNEKLQETFRAAGGGKAANPCAPKKAVNPCMPKK